jgi:hypothetical protein
MIEIEVTGDGDVTAYCHLHAGVGLQAASKYLTQIQICLLKEVSGFLEFVELEIQR